MKITIPILAILLMIPTAQALVVIPISQNNLGTTNLQERDFTMTNTENVSFQLSGPVFAYHAYGNTTIQNTDTGYLEESVEMGSNQITSSHTYHYTIEFNGTQNLDINFEYDRSGFLGLYRWTETLTINYQGNNICSATYTGPTIGGIINGFEYYNPANTGTGSIPAISTSIPSNPLSLLGPSIRPNPQVILNYVQNATDVAQNQTPQLLHYIIMDGVVGSTQGARGGNIACNNPNTGDQTIPMNQLTEGFNFQISNLDGNSHQVRATWGVQNATAWDTFQTTQPATSTECRGLHVHILILDFCFNISGLLDLIFGGVFNGLAFFLGFLPGGTMLSAILVTPVQMMLGLIGFIQDILFNSDSPYGPVGIFWWFEVLAFTYGCIATCFDGNFKHPFVFPWKLFLYWLYILVYGSYFFFYLLPKAAAQIITWAWIAITNPVP